MKEPELEAFAEARFIVCPRRAQRGRRASGGSRASACTACGRRATGVAAISRTCAPLIDTLAPAGAAFIALNPLHAIPNRQPYNTSPYLPQCSLFRNFLYLDVGTRAGFLPEDAPEAEIDALRATEFVEYERVADIEAAGAARGFRAISGVGPYGATSRNSREIEGALLHDFAVFCALDEEMHRRNPDVWLWTDWPAEYRDPRSPAVAEFAEEHRDDVLFYKFLQWQIDRQLAEAQAHAHRARA